MDLKASSDHLITDDNDTFKHAIYVPDFFKNLHDQVREQSQKLIKNSLVVLRIACYRLHHKRKNNDLENLHSSHPHFLLSPLQIVFFDNMCETITQLFNGLFFVSCVLLFKKTPQLLQLCFFAYFHFRISISVIFCLGLGINEILKECFKLNKTLCWLIYHFNY